MATSEQSGGRRAVLNKLFNLKADGSILGRWLADGAASTEKIEDLAVTNEKILGPIPNSKLADIAADKITGTALTEVSTFAGDVSGTFNSLLIGNRNAFRATLSGNQSVATGASATVVDLDQEDYDYGSFFDITTSRMTPTVAGIYLLIGSVSFESVADGSRGVAALLKNGSEIKWGSMSPGGAIGWHVSSVMDLVQANGTTDYFELGAAHDHGSNRDVNAGSGYTSLSGILVART